jgi:hypothetical protein
VLLFVLQLVYFIIFAVTLYYQLVPGDLKVGTLIKFGSL